MSSYPTSEVTQDVDKVCCTCSGLPPEDPQHSSSTDSLPFSDAMKEHLSRHKLSDPILPGAMSTSAKGSLYVAPDISSLRTSIIVHPATENVDVSSQIWHRVTFREPFYAQEIGALYQERLAEVGIKKSIPPYFDTGEAISLSYALARRTRWEPDWNGGMHLQHCLKDHLRKFSKPALEIDLINGMDQGAATSSLFTFYRYVLASLIGERVMIDNAEEALLVDVRQTYAIQNGWEREVNVTYSLHLEFHCLTFNARQIGSLGDGKMTFVKQEALPPFGCLQCWAFKLN